MAARAMIDSGPKPNAGTTPAKPYERTERERAIVEALREEQKLKPAPPLFKSSRNEASGASILDLDHPDLQTSTMVSMAALGNVSVTVWCMLTEQLARLCSIDGEINDERLNGLMGLAVGVRPQDEIEAMLAVQMAAIHDATMTQASRLKRSETISQQDSNEKALNKLARTFATQVEAIKRYRTGGQQTVTVEHVTVNEGGQAIVGNVETGGGGRDEK